MIAFFVFATVIDVLAATWLLMALFGERQANLPKWMRLGLLIGSVGLMWQAFRNVWFLVTGISMSDANWPMWFLKDFGYFVIAASEFYLFTKSKITRPAKKQGSSKK